jgi:hypothetical protein
MTRRQEIIAALILAAGTIAGAVILTWAGPRMNRPSPATTPAVAPPPEKPAPAPPPHERPRLPRPFGPRGDEGALT